MIQVVPWRDVTVAIDRLRGAVITVGADLAGRLDRLIASVDALTAALLHEPDE